MDLSSSAGDGMCLGKVCICSMPETHHAVCIKKYVKAGSFSAFFTPLHEPQDLEVHHVPRI